MDKWLAGWIDGWIDRQVDRQIYRQIYRQILDVLHTAKGQIRVKQNVFLPTSKHSDSQLNTHFTVAYQGKTKCMIKEHTYNRMQYTYNTVQYNTMAYRAELKTDTQIEHYNLHH